MPSYKDWFNKHKSSNFIALILMVSIIFLMIGIFIPTNSRALNYLSIVMMQLSAVCITTAIVTIFFNFDDVKDYMSKSISHLWINGKIISSLSDETRTNIDREIILSTNKSLIKTIDESLYNDLTSLRNRALSDFMMTNYNVRIILTDSKKYANMVYREMFISYRIHTFHLSDPQKPFPLRFEFSLNVSKSIELPYDELIPKFTLKVGKNIFTKADINITKLTAGSLNSVSVKFEKGLSINQAIDVEITFESLTLKNNNNEVVLMRYPTQGLNVSLDYTDAYDFEGCFFKALESVKDITSINDHQNVHAHGISLSSNSWVLPGYGIVLGYYPKQE